MALSGNKTVVGTASSRGDIGSRVSARTTAPTRGVSRLTIGDSTLPVTLFMRPRFTHLTRRTRNNIRGQQACERTPAPAVRSSLTFQLFPMSYKADSSKRVTSRQTASRSIVGMNTTLASTSSTWATSFSRRILASSQLIYASARAVRCMFAIGTTQ